MITILLCRRLDDKVAKLKKEQCEKLEVWEEKTSPLEAWLNETEVELEAFEPIGVDLETTKAQREKAQVEQITIYILGFYNLFTQHFKDLSNIMIFFYT